ncbi:hypothetical protein [Kitasatospora sp. NPDC056531]|uniref:hypothetical protein n=1 Tax=Kitasatospora sp. NPDC056531 TaxID=3345856 RepID=UPI0036B1AC3D
MAPHEDVLRGSLSPASVCRTPWALGFSLPGIMVTLSARADGDFAFLSVSRSPSDAGSRCPVRLHGVDVLGRPAHEVAEALRAQGHDVLDRLHRDVRFGPLHLGPRAVTHPDRPDDAEPRDRRELRREPPFSFGFISLSAPPAPSALSAPPGAPE